MPVKLHQSKKQEAEWHIQGETELLHIRVCVNVCRRSRLSWCCSATTLLLATSWRRGVCGILDSQATSNAYLTSVRIASFVYINPLLPYGYGYKAFCARPG